MTTVVTQEDGEVRVADVAGCCDPGTGGIHRPALPAVPERLGYKRVVALEGLRRPGGCPGRFLGVFIPAGR